MLKQRILTALILIPLLVLLILKASLLVFCVVTGVLVLIGAWEWSLLLGLTKFTECVIYPLVILLAMIASLMLPITYAFYIALVSWLIGLGLVIAYPKGRATWGTGILWRGIMGILVLIPCWIAINFIRTPVNGPFLLLFLIGLICVADSAAYFIGRKWGTHKILAEVSPGKSWEGLAGAIVATVLFSWGVLYYVGTPHEQWFWSIALCVVVVLFSVIGDLFESMLKRNVGVKDSGKLLPGHGGLLDRIDSLTAAAPVFALGAMWLGEWFR